VCGGGRWGSHVQGFSGDTTGEKGLLGEGQGRKRGTGGKIWFVDAFLGLCRCDSVKKLGGNEKWGSREFGSLSLVGGGSKTAWYEGETHPTGCRDEVESKTVDDTGSCL